jgi:hypothetical protein
MVRFEREQILTVASIFLVISSVGLVAATIDSVSAVQVADDASDQDRDQVQTGPDDRINVDVSGESEGDTEREQAIDLVVCIEILQRPSSILGIVAGVVVLLYGIYRRYNGSTAGLASTAIFPVVFASYFLLTNCGPSSGSGDTLLSGTEIMSGSGGVEAPGIPPALLAVVLGGAVIVAVATLYNMTGEEESFELVEDETDEPDAADFARAAGNAADRIQEKNVSVDNAVYRAWLEMTGLLNIENPDTTAPRDFAEAAIDTGLAADDVYELTELFNEVRYGGKSPEGREDRATEVLRNIERTYEDVPDHDRTESETDDRTEGER